MKKVLLVILLMLLSLPIFAQPVSKSVAEDVADFFLELNSKSSQLKEVINLKNKYNITVAYIANIKPTGFIAISTDTDIQPIIAYSFQSNFIFDDDENNILYHTILNDMSSRLDAVNNGALPDVYSNNTLWSHYLTQNISFFNQRDPQFWPPQGVEYPTGGWIGTNWFQEGIYNDFCPIDPATNERSYVGCVATALAQLLNYHKYIGDRVWTTANDSYVSNFGGPSEIHIDQDSNQYDFPNFVELNGYLDDLRNSFGNGSNPYTDEIRALSLVSGVACNMRYSSQGSGASISNNDLLDKFEYYSATQIVGNSQLALNELLIPDMKNGLPALLTVGPDASMMSHEIICDGYQITDDFEDFFHLNYGWDSYYNAWYNLPNYPANYFYRGNAIINIAPPNFQGSVSGYVTLPSDELSYSDVTVTAGNLSVTPFEFSTPIHGAGYYEIELYNGNYEVSAYLAGYENDSVEIEIIANQETANINFSFIEATPTLIYVPNDYPTIQEGINAAYDGDIVIVLDGEYFENINFNGKRIKVVSWYYMNADEQHIDNTIINANMTDRVVTFNSGEDSSSLLEGFTITGGYIEEGLFSSNAGILCFYSSPVLKNLKVKNNSSSRNSGIGLYNSEAMLDNVEIFNNTNFTIDNNSPAVYCETSNLNFSNVNIYNNNNVGIKSTNSIINFINSSICNNGTSSNSGYGIYSTSTDIELTSCLLWGNNSTSQISYSTSSTLNANYNCIQNGTGEDYFDNGTGNISCDPIVDSDFKPMWTSSQYSPLIDSGDPSIIDPDGTPSDIGAVRADAHKVESIELMDSTEGVNWKCFPVLDDVYADSDIAEVFLFDIQQEPYPLLNFVDSFGNTANISFDGTYWSNNTQQFTSAKGYKIHMNDPYTLEVTGFLENSNETIQLVSGENWLGYFPVESMKPLDAFSAVLDDIDEIKTRDFSHYKLADGTWLSMGNSSNYTLNYGDLVIVNCSNPSSFYWGEQGGGSSTKSTREKSEDFAYTEKADYIPVYVELDNQELGYPQEIGLFVDGECKGAEVITDSLVQVRAYVLNDTTAYDPGDVEFQLSYGSRSESIKIRQYRIKGDLNSIEHTTKLDFSKNPQRYYQVSLNNSEEPAPEVINTAVSQNYPNPFNPTTTINYSLAMPCDVDLTIFNIKGQKVKTLVNAKQNTGHYQAAWDGKNSSNKQVASGVYFYKLTTPEKSLNKKMLLLK